jgi:hypothetical protein
MDFDQSICFKNFGRSKMLRRCVDNIFFLDKFSAGSPSSRFLIFETMLISFSEKKRTYLQRARGVFLYFAHTNARNTGSKSTFESAIFWRPQVL